VIEGYALFLSALILLGGALGTLRPPQGLRVGRRALRGGFHRVRARRQYRDARRSSLHPRDRRSTADARSLSLISAAYSGEERGRAIGLWSGFSALTAPATDYRRLAHAGVFVALRLRD